MSAQHATETNVSRHGMEETMLNHPAYGQMSVTRVQCGGQGMHLYGSDFGHSTVVKIEISRSEMRRSLARDWRYEQDQIVSLYLSESQWAAFVSSFGLGEGVAVTLRATERDGQLPEIVLRDSGEIYKVEANEATKKAVADLQASRAKVAASLVGLSKTKQAEVLGEIDNAIKQLNSSLPFIVDSFSEHMEDRVEKAKGEIAAHLSDTVRRAGMQVLQGGPPVLTLGGPKD